MGEHLDIESGTEVARRLCFGFTDRPEITTASPVYQPEASQGVQVTGDGASFQGVLLIGS